MASQGRHLYQHEAKWGRRIRSALEGLNLWEQSVVIDQYALRELTAYCFKYPEGAYTADLDGILAYQPWKPESKEAYERAVICDVVPRPLGYGWIEPFELDVDQFNALNELEAGEIDAETYLDRMSSWNVAVRMFDQRPRVSTNVDAEKEPFLGWLLDQVLEFWGAGSQEQSVGQSVAPEGENREG